MSIWKKLAESFGIDEANVDDEGQPLRTPDPFAPPVKHKAQNSAFGSIRATPKSNNDKTLDAVTSPNAINVAAKGGNKPMARGATARTPQHIPGPAIPGKPTQYAKPPYKGSYVGQTWTTNDKTVSKNTAWQGANGDPRFGKVQSMQKVTMVWDGQDWIPQDQFDAKSRMGQLKKK